MYIHRTIPLSSCMHEGSTFLYNNVRITHPANIITNSINIWARDFEPSMVQLNELPMES